MNILRIHLVILLLLLVSLSGPGQLKGDRVAHPTSHHTNAALKYLRAYAALHQSKAISPDTAKLIENYLTVPLDGAAAELAAAAEDALREMHHGAAIRQCNWGISAKDGIEADTSHRGVARDLIAVASLRARLRFREGRVAEANDDLVAAITLAHHLSLDGTLTSPLIAYTLEQGPTELLARHLPELRRDDLRRLAARFESMPSGANLADVLLSHERISREILIGEVRLASGRQELLKRLAALPGLKTGAAEFLDACGGTGDGIVRKVEQLRTRYLVWAKRFRLPPEHFEETYKAEAAKLSKTNPVFHLLTPSISRVRWAEAYRQTKRALLQAAIAVQRDGIKGLGRHLDPYDGHPFQYIGTQSGFRLQSRLKQSDKALIISVGTADRN